MSVEIESRSRLSPRQIASSLGAATWLLLSGSLPAGAQSLQAFDDEFFVPYAQTLVVEAFGVLDNDILNDEAAGELGASAELLVDASHGTLTLTPDGAFDYSPGPGFDGQDQFVYRAVFGAVSSPATVRLSACGGGPPVFTCWKQGAFLALADSHGFPHFQEGFEDEAVWGASRSPDTLPSVSSRGFEWRANDFDPTHLVPPFPANPPPNRITTGTGPARTGLYGVFDRAHGYAVGSSFACDTDPTANCFYHDGMTIAREPATGPLHGAGGYFSPTNSADVAIVLDGDWQSPIGGGQLSGGPHQFFGVIDTGPVGFSEIQFREVDGRISDAFFIFADDFTLLAEPTGIPVPSLNVLGLAALATLIFSLSLRVLRTPSS